MKAIAGFFYSMFSAEVDWIRRSTIELYNKWSRYHCQYKDKPSYQDKIVEFLIEHMDCKFDSFQPIRQGQDSQVVEDRRLKGCLNRRVRDINLLGSLTSLSNPQQI